jgi:hypothetical protein
MMMATSARDMSCPFMFRDRRIEETIGRRKKLTALVPIPAMT